MEKLFLFQDYLTEGWCRNQGYIFKYEASIMNKTQCFSMQGQTLTKVKKNLNNLSLRLPNDWVSYS